MSDLVTKSVNDRVARLVKARDSAQALLNATASKWENSCEDLFSEFRVSCVHLRKEREALDAIEDKQVAWRFICKFSRSRPFLHDRCSEVLKILMLSDAWMKAFVDDADTDINDLPPAVADEFRRRASEVEGGPREGSGPPAVMIPTGMPIVVQRCLRARVLVDEDKGVWGEIGPGLIVSVSFAKDASEERVRNGAKFLMKAKLSTVERPEPGKRPSGGGGEPVSVETCCKRGVPQGILVIPQPSLICAVDETDLNLSYTGLCDSKTARNLYGVFIEALQEYGQEIARDGGSGESMLKVVAGDFAGRQFHEHTSAGPFIHTLHF
eukprot:TRINITY_DN58547_c0_g1_i1.p1 TRINITY_DN58547_c0_g1~~TRINITY_DN58547_c0_g1_i1.p1  ORF type:complete len:324 (+),score=48.14 TRINITY_DN58547_c0_g1_i1:48-1019(+)